MRHSAAVSYSIAGAKSMTCSRRKKTRKTILMYSSETWKLTEKIINRVQVFINRCLRKILNISNDELWKRTEQEPISTQLNRRK